MKDKTKARSAVAAVEQAIGTTTGKASDSFNNNIISTNDRQIGPIESLLLSGAENAIKTTDLVHISGYRNTRDLQQQIERERAAGALILSKSTHGGGYFIASTREEIAAYERTLMSRALSTLKTLQAARKALSDIDGQQQMKGV